MDYMTAYYRKESDSLKRAAAAGTLREVSAPDGKMYILPMESSDFPVAIITNSGMVIRNGDEIRMERGGQVGPAFTHTTAVCEFYIDEGTNEFHYRFICGGRVPAGMSIRHAVENISAIVRADAALRRAGDTE